MKNWDQDKLKDIYFAIKKHGDNPDEYIDIQYSVCQNKYEQWPEHIKNIFKPAIIENNERLPEIGSYYKRLDCMGKWKCVDLQIERTPDGQRIAIITLDNQANVERFDLKKGFWNHFKEYSV